MVRLFKITVCIMICCFVQSISFAQDNLSNKLSKKKIIYFENGKAFDSFEDYKLMKIKEIFFSHLPLDDDESFQKFIQFLKAEYPDDKIENLTLAQIKKEIFDFIDIDISTVEGDQNGSEELISEMQEMLVDYNKENKDSYYEKIDLNKIKIITISPHTNETSSNPR